MKHIFTPKRICRAGVIAALYVALTYAFMPVSYQGIMQIRPGEALTILPLFFPEAVPALWIGCMLSNLASPFIVYDVRSAARPRFLPRFSPSSSEDCCASKTQKRAPMSQEWPSEDSSR